MKLAIVLIAIAFAVVSAERLNCDQIRKGVVQIANAIKKEKSQAVPNAVELKKLTDDLTYYANQLQWTCDACSVSKEEISKDIKNIEEGKGGYPSEFTDRLKGNIFSCSIDRKALTQQVFDWTVAAIEGQLKSASPNASIVEELNKWIGEDFVGMQGCEMNKKPIDAIRKVIEREAEKFPLNSTVFAPLNAKIASLGQWIFDWQYCRNERCWVLNESLSANRRQMQRQSDASVIVRLEIQDAKYLKQYSDSKMWCNDETKCWAQHESLNSTRRALQTEKAHVYPSQQVIAQLEAQEVENLKAIVDGMTNCWEITTCAFYNAEKLRADAEIAKAKVFGDQKTVDRYEAQIKQIQTIKDNKCEAEPTVRRWGRDLLNRLIRH